MKFIKHKIHDSPDPHLTYEMRAQLKREEKLLHSWNGEINTIIISIELSSLQNYRSFHLQCTRGFDRLLIFSTNFRPLWCCFLRWVFETRQSPCKHCTCKVARWMFRFDKRKIYIRVDKEVWTKNKQTHNKPICIYTTFWCMIFSIQCAQHFIKTNARHNFNGASDFLRSATKFLCERGFLLLFFVKHARTHHINPLLLFRAHSFLFIRTIIFESVCGG